MTLDLIIFFGLAMVAVGTALSMLISPNAVYSALFLVLNFLAIAVIYLLLNAAFIALVQVTVYAGAIMVLFLFVIMLLGAERVEQQPSIAWQKWVAGILGLGLVALIGLVISRGDGILLERLRPVMEGFGSPASIGELLFNEYLVPFEATSVLLLVAMIGVIVITLIVRKESR